MKDAIKGIFGNLDKGFYGEAKRGENGPRASYGFLTDMLAGKGFGPSQAEIDAKVARLMARSKMRCTSPDQLPPMVLEAFETYAADTWGLEKLLAEAGIRVKGAGADRVEKFFATTSSAVLFPAFLESQIVAGILMVPILGSLIATEININAHVYQSLAMADTTADRQFGKVGEGAKMGRTRIQTADRSIYLFKYGRVLETTYEALRMQRANVVALFFQRIGQQLAGDETDDAIYTLIAGDGNTGSDITDANDLDADVSGTFDYDECVKLDLEFMRQGYQMSTVVTSSTNIRTVLNMAEFKDPLAGFSFQRTGALPGPMGADWHVWENTDATYYKTDIVLAVDNRLALEQVTEQGVMTESDKIIDQQLNETAVSKWTGFAKLDYEATQVLDITA